MMRRVMLHIAGISVAATCIAGNMASQPWVEMRLSQITNSVRESIRAEMDSLREELREQIVSSISSIPTNATASEVDEAITNSVLQAVAAAMSSEQSYYSLLSSLSSPAPEFSAGMRCIVARTTIDGLEGTVLFADTDNDYVMQFTNDTTYVRMKSTPQYPSAFFHRRIQDEAEIVLYPMFGDKSLVYTNATHEVYLTKLGGE